ncbi:MAG: hypothetical protein V3U76_14170 [Granulosicoccus sp.]
MSDENHTNDRRNTERRDKHRNRRFWRAMSVERRHSNDNRKSVAQEPGESVTQTAAESPDNSSSSETNTDVELESIELTHDISALSDEELNARRKMLRSMLKVSETRHANVSKRRLPVLTPGQQVLVVRGEWQGKLATILDADYIRGRVLLSSEGEPHPAWLKFSRIGAVPSSE